MMCKEKVLIIDFGGQYTMLIAKQVRELSVYSEIVPFSKCMERIKKEKPIGIIFSGGPNSVYEKDAPLPPLEIFELGIPILGICYGMQAIAQVLGGKVEKNEVQETGHRMVSFDKTTEIFSTVSDGADSLLMNHVDCVSKLPEGFTCIASTSSTKNAAMMNEEKKIYGVQFHPEVMASDKNKDSISNFLYKICKANKTWQRTSFISNAIEKIKQEVKDKKVLLALSGGVDSSVLAYLLSKAIGEALTCVFVDTGLMRKNEGSEIKERFEKLPIRFIYIDAKKKFLESLKGVTDPEAKRKAIGETFIRVFEESAKEIGEVDFLAQGTIYADVVESGASGSSKVIKSHHNVGGLPKDMKFKGIIEPFRELFKDEVRALGTELGVPSSIVNRQPFPGPGLAIRIIGEVTEEKLEILRDADDIWCKTIEKKMTDGISQYFAILTDIKTVGVTGDFRTYNYVIALRAVKTDDFMTAEAVHFSSDVYDEASTRILAEVKGINRVVYDLTSKPPATIEWE
ncbi:MAG: glutamine-hydrolyzing GMP synthase [Treponema sp.]